LFPTLLGPAFGRLDAPLRFRLVVHGQGEEWVRYFFQARVSARGARYRFEIDARLALLGTFIRYTGELDVID
jgi:hypothetical protein